MSRARLTGTKPGLRCTAVSRTSFAGAMASDWSQWWSPLAGVIWSRADFSTLLLVTQSCRSPSTMALIFDSLPRSV